MPHGTWLVKFSETNRGLLEPWEVGSDPSSFCPGMDRTLRDFRDQVSVRNRIGCDAIDTQGDLFATVHTTLARIDVMIRARNPYEQWSGWSFYAADRRDEAHEHERLYTILGQRPELAQFLALPEGFAVDVSTERVYRTGA